MTERGEEALLPLPCRATHCAQLVLTFLTVKSGHSLSCQVSTILDTRAALKTKKL